MRMMVRDMKGCRIIEWVHWIRGIIMSRMVWRNRFRMMICRGSLRTVGMMRCKIGNRDGIWCRGM